MPLDSRKVAHVAANRAKIRAGRSETVTLVSAGGGTVGYQTVAGVVWRDAGQVPAGIASRVGDVTRAPWDAMAELPGETVFPDGLKLVARTATATAAGVAAAARYVVLDKVRAGLGTTGSGGGGNAGNRWMVKLRLLR
ncbi:MAG: hypothetical protein HY332_10585 [Chloroflexi bacterium]|nr:hypothetical protein [Chloroflexota bacterium]